MPKLQTKKSSDNSNNGFNETVEYKVLHQANVETNHNKFYVVEIQKNVNNQYRLFTHYGRLGISNIYEVRETVKGNNTPITDLDTVKSEFEDIIKKKLKGKRNTDTGEMEAYVEVDTVAPTVGSENIRGKAEKSKQVTVKAAIDTSSFKPQVSKLLDQLIEENIHSITSHTSIKYTANGFATELGPVTKDHVDRARLPLKELNTLMGDKGQADPSMPEVKRLNSLYFSLIPKPFSRKITENDMILDANVLETEFDVLEQLETAVTMGTAMSGSTTQRINALGTELDILEDINEINRIKKYIRESKSDNHSREDVWNYAVKCIYKISIPEEKLRFKKSPQVGNIKELFHGSANSNLLSICKSGLIIPKSSAGHVTGRLYSDGVYFSDSSTKSLRYSLGYWGAKRSKFNNAFLFLADVALGKTYTTYSTSYPYKGAKPDFDSTSALKNKVGYGGLYNNEYIVYKLNQQTLSYLVELTPRGK